MKILDPNTATAGSHSRASTATFIGSDGLLQTAGVDVPRLQYNPLNLAEAPSYLFEAAATNLLIRSGQLDNAAWGKSNLTVSADLVINGLTVDKLVENTAVNVEHYTEQALTSVAGTYTTVWRVVAGERTRGSVVVVHVGEASATSEVAFDLVAKTIGLSGNRITATSITALADGSIELKVIFSITAATTSFRQRLRMSSGTGAGVYTGDGTSGMHVVSVQTETGAVATSYIPTTTAPVTRAADLSTAGVVASSVLENDHPAYNPATNYAALVRVVSASSIYESAQTPNTGNTPLTSPLFWTRISATNRMKMFDAEVSTLTTATSFISAVVAPGLVDSLAVFAALGATLKVTGTDGLGGPVVYAKTIALDASTVGDWYEWTYQPFLPVTTIVLSDLPLYGSLHVSVTISGVGAVAMGLLAFGRIEAVGNTQHGLSVDVRESKRTNTAVKYLTTRLEGPQTDFDRVVRLIEKLRSKTIVLVSTDVPGYESLNIFGKVQSWSVAAAGPNHYESDLTFEGSL